MIVKTNEVLPESFSDMHPVGILYYERHRKESDRPVKVTLETFETLLGYEPKWFRGTYNEYCVMMDRVIKQYDDLGEDVFMADKIAFSRDNPEWSKSQILKIEKLEGFHGWLTEYSLRAVQLFKNYELHNEII